MLRALADIGYDGVISIELEDVPGAATDREASTPALERELGLAQAYLRERAAEAGVTIAPR